MINIEQLVNEVLGEQNMSGGEGSAFGPGVQSTATHQSGDNYAPGDARNLFGSGKKPGVITRWGLNRSKRKKRKSKKKKN